MVLDNKNSMVSCETNPPKPRRKHTPESRAKMSASKIGKGHSPESREKNRIASTGRNLSPEAREKISAKKRERDLLTNRALVAERNQTRRLDPEYLNRTVSGEIYLITCLPTGKQYVGQTIQGAMTRWSQHKYKAGDGFYLGNALKYHGDENFTMVVIDTATTPNDLNTKERLWIEKLNTLVPNGYNLNSGGDNVFERKHSLESIEKIRLKAIGRKHGPEAKAKISAANIGKTITPENIEKLRQANTGRIKSEEEKAKMKENWRRSPEGAERIRLASLGRKKSPETKSRISKLAKDRWKNAPNERLIVPSFEGKTHTSESKIKISMGNQGKIRTQEAKDKISSSKTGVPWSEKRREAWLKSQTPLLEVKICTAPELDTPTDPPDQG